VPTIHNTVGELLERNRSFAEHHHTRLPYLPTRRTCVVTCPDARVDPAHVLGLQLGEAAVVRAAAGRLSPIVLQQLLFLSAAGAAGGLGADGLELVLVQHTDCGITHLLGPEHRELLATFLGVTVDGLAGLAPDDPYRGIRVDIDLLAANPLVPAALAVTGLVYDVATGRAEVVERRAPLRPTDVATAATKEQR
jgi:carbonic anhydrase